MIKQIILGIWVCLATLGGVYGAGMMSNGSDGNVKDAVHVSGISYVSTMPLSVPIVRDGDVVAYVVAKFVYGVRENKLQGHQREFETHFVDSVFRVIYNAESIRFAEKRRADLDAIKKEIIAKTNESLGREMLEEVLIEQLSYVLRDQVRCSKKMPN